MFNTCQPSHSSSAHSGDKHAAEMPEYQPAPDSSPLFSRGRHRSQSLGGATVCHVVRQFAKLENHSAFRAWVATAWLWPSPGSSSPTGDGHPACPSGRCRADDALPDGRIARRPIWTHCQNLRERGAPMPLKACCAGIKPAIGAGSPPWLQRDFARLRHG